jgi:hypothetical protein
LSLDIGRASITFFSNFRSGKQRETKENEQLISENVGAEWIMFYEGADKVIRQYHRIGCKQDLGNGIQHLKHGCKI